MNGFPTFDNDLAYPETSPGNYDIRMPFDEPDVPEQNNPMAMLEDYRQRWIKENEQTLDDWEYFYYGIPAGNETFLGLGD